MFLSILRTKSIVNLIATSTSRRGIALTSAKLNDFRPSEELAQERYEIRANEDIEKKRSRLLYQSRKRGMLENGVILASFADKYLKSFNANQLDQYDKLINLPTNDWDIFYWATGTKPTPPEYETTVMQQLRDHLKSKVSKELVSKSQPENDSQHRQQTLFESKLFKGKRPDDVIMPAIKRKYNLEPDFSEISLTDYKEELFDDRKIKLGRGLHIQAMTQWRKKFFEQRLRRTIPAPVTVRNLDDSKATEVFTQVRDRKDIACQDLINDQLQDTKAERIIKHHKVISYLLNSNLTDDALEYDDEALAWANMMWHRDYGSLDIKIAPSTFKCPTCDSYLNCCDHGQPGYVPKEIFARLNPDNILNCQLCEFKSKYGIYLDVDLDLKNYERVLSQIKSLPTSVICVLVDLTDIPGSIFPNLIEKVGLNHRFIIVGNKIDLMPYDGNEMINRLTDSLRKSLSNLRPDNSNLRIDDVHVISAKTGFGIEGLVTRLLYSSDIDSRDIYILGSSNSGKSTLFNALLQSDLCAIREGELLGRVAPSEWSELGIKTLKFPINKIEEWELQLKKRKGIIIERNPQRLERYLKRTTKERQATMPHMSLLVDRLDYPSSSVTSSGSTSEQVTKFEDRVPTGDEINEIKYTDDHPLAKIKLLEPFHAGKSEEYRKHAFVHQVPSLVHPDQLHTLLTLDERLQVFPLETIIPRKYSIRPLQSIFVAGLARLDLLTSTSVIIITVFASRYLPIHVIATRKADQFYNTFLGTPYLGVPFGNQERLQAWPGLAVSSKPITGKGSLKEDGTDMHVRGTRFDRGAADIVLGSVGWALVNVSADQECILRAHTPGGRGVALRDPPLLPFGGLVKGKKIRDTPLFHHSDYSNRRRRA